MNEKQNIHVERVSLEEHGSDEQHLTPIFNPKYMLLLVLLFEGAVIVIALLISWFGFYDHDQPLARIDGQLLVSIAEFIQGSSRSFI